MPVNTQSRSRYPQKKWPRANRLWCEQLEDRITPAGGLTATIVPGANPYILVDNSIDIRATDSAGEAKLSTFWSSPNGQAAAINFDGSFTADGRTVSGSFNLAEQTGGVALTIANGSVTFGTTPGIVLSDASGAFDIVPAGIAGTMNAENQANGGGLSVTGLPGLNLGTTPAGVAFNLNTTGTDQSLTLPATLGGGTVSVPNAANELDGAADFSVSGPSGKVFDIAGTVAITDDATGAIAVAATDVTLTVYAGSVAAAAIHSESAAMTLGTDAATGDPSFHLDPTSITVDGFSLLPAENIFPTFPAGSQSAGMLTLPSVQAGPFTLTNASMALPDLSIVGSELELGLSIQADEAGLSFTKSSSTGSAQSDTFTADAKNVAGLFTLTGSIDASSGKITSFGTPGKFSFSADSLDLEVPHLLSATATNITIGYDPQASGVQTLLQADTLDVSVPLIGLDGSFTPSDSNPGLTITTNGFTFGMGRVTLDKTIPIPGVLTLVNPYVELDDLSFSTTAGLSLGGFAIGADSVTIGKSGGKFSFEGDNVEAAVTLAAGDTGIASVALSADTVTGQFGSFLTVTATNISFNPTASGSDPILSFATASVALNIPVLDLSGSIGPFSILANGDLQAGDNFSVQFSATDQVANSVKWPSFIPLAHVDVSLAWDNFNADPADFIITINASVTDTLAGTVMLSGSVQGLQIDPQRLADGEFPIIGLDSAVISASGSIFGGQLSGSLGVGILKVDSNGDIVDTADDPTAPYDHTVFYADLSGSFQFSGYAGLELRVGFSQLGPLDGYIDATAPIELEPFAGTTIDDFRGGIAFDATPIQAPSTPEGLLQPIFQPTTSLTGEQFDAQVRQQAINQIGRGSFLFNYSADQLSPVTSVSDVMNTISGLDAGTIATGSGFENTFLQDGYPLIGAESVITTVQSGQLWTIQDQGAYYLVQLTGDATDPILKVSALRTILNESLIGGLSGPVISPDLAAAFQAQGINVDDAATVAVQVTDPNTGNPTQWQVTTTDGHQYIVQDLGVALAVVGSAGTLADLRFNVRIEAGASIYSQYASKSAISGDVDFIWQTDGQIILKISATIGSQFPATIRLYGDLSEAFYPANTGPIQFIMLGDFPSDNSMVSHAVEIAGQAEFELLDADGNSVNPENIGTADTIRAFSIKVLGKATINALNEEQVVIGGDSGNAADEGILQLTITADPNDSLYGVTLDVQGSLSIDGVISAEDLVSGEGRVVLQEDNGQFQLYGALKLNADSNSPGLDFLEEAGIAADGDLLLTFNPTPDAQSITLTLPGRAPFTTTIEADSMSLEIQGSLTIQKDLFGIGGDIIFNGVFGAYFTVNQNGSNNPLEFTTDTDLFVTGRMDVDVQVPGVNLSLFSFDALGLIAIENVGAESTPQVGALLDLVAQRGIPNVYQQNSGLDQLILNLTGQTFQYQVSPLLQDRLNLILQQRANPPQGSVSIPALPFNASDPPPLTITPGGLVSIPAAPPPLLDGDQFQAAPYFFVQIGDPTHPGTGDASITILDSIKLTGDFRIIVGGGGLELVANARAGFAVPTFANLLSGNAEGVFRITSAGLVGAVALNTHTDIPIPDVSFDADAFLELNTTSGDVPITITATDGTTLTDTAKANSAEFVLDGEMDLAAFQLNGLFDLELTGSPQDLTGTMTLDIDAGLSFFGNQVLEVQKSVEVGANFNFTLDANLGGASNSLLPFSLGDIFSATGDLDLHVNTATHTFAISVSNLSLDLLDAVDFTGSGSIGAYVEAGTGNHYLVLSGSLGADFFDVADMSASATFDSRGYFDVNLTGGITLGNSDYGISADANFYILRSDTVPLDFGGSVHGEVDGFGLSLGGVDVDLDYDSSSGRIKLSADVEVDVPILGDESLGTVSFTIGTLILSGQDNPQLGSMDGSELVLNVGADAVNRNLSPDVTDESFTIESLGAGSVGGEKLRVRGLGAEQVFDNVSSISGDFGDGDDSLTILPDVGTFAPITFNITDGDGDDQLVNDSSASGSFSVGGGTDMLVGGNGHDVLTAGGGTDTLVGGGSDTLIGGSGSDTYAWRVGDGSGIRIVPGTGPGKLEVDGTNAAEDYTIGESNGQVTVTVTGATTESISAAVDDVEIKAAGGADVIRVGTLPASVNLTLSLGQVVTSTTTSNGSGTGQVLDDDAADLVELQGTTGADTFAIDTTNNMVRVSQSGAATVFIEDTTPSLDTLQINGNGGNDAFSVASPDPVTLDSATKHLKIQLTGGAGNDTFNVVPGNIAITGGGGNDTVNERVANGDPTDLTLAAASFRAGIYTSNFAGIANVGVDVENGGNLLVQSTGNGPTSVTLGDGGMVKVLSTSGRLSLALNGGTTTATLQATGGPVTVSGGAGDSTVQVGTGLMNRIGSSVNVSDVSELIYDDAFDGANLAATIDSSGVSGLPAAGTLTHSGVDQVTLELGLGDDTANVTLGSSAFLVDGGSGTNAVTATLNGSPAALNLYDDSLAALQTANDKTVTFTNANNTTVTDWSLDHGTLTSGTLIVLDAGSAAALNATLGEGSGNTLDVLAVNQATNLTVRGSTAVTIGGLRGITPVTLDDIAANLAITGTTDANSLTLDDSNSPTNLDQPRLRTFTADSVSGPDQAGVISFDPSKFAAINVLLGQAFDQVTLENAAYTTIDGGDGNDSFTASGNLGDLTIDGEGGNDSLLVKAGTGTVNFLGGAGADSVTSDSTANSVNVNASFTSTPGSAAIAIDGLPTVQLAVPGDIEQVTMNLGAGNDQVTINDPYLAVPLNLNTGDGDDTVNVLAVTGPEGSDAINGQGGSDTIRVVVPGAPTANQFAAVAPTAEQLIIDNSTGTAPVNWVSNGTVVSGNGLNVIDTSGASQVLIEGGTSNADTLQVSNTVSTNDASVTVAANRVHIYEGASVLSFNSAVTSLGATAPVTGLAGARAVASTPNGEFVFAGGTGDGILVSQKNGQNLDPLEVFITPDLNSPAHMAMSSDGTHLFVEATNASNQTVLVVLSVNLTTGALSESQVFTLDGPLTALTVVPRSSQEDNIIAVSSASYYSTALYSFQYYSFLNPGTVSTPSTIGGNTLPNITAVAATSGSVYVTDGTGLVQLNYGTGSNFNVLSVAQTFPLSSSGVDIASGNQVQAVPSQNLLLIYSASDSTLRYYDTSSEHGGAPVALQGSIDDAGGASSEAKRVFDYNPDTGVLFLLGNSGTEVLTYLRGSDGYFTKVADIGQTSNILQNWNEIATTPVVSGTQYYATVSPHIDTQINPGDSYSSVEIQPVDTSGNMSIADRRDYAILPSGETFQGPIAFATPAVSVYGPSAGVFLAVTQFNASSSSLGWVAISPFGYGQLMMPFGQAQSFEADDVPPAGTIDVQTDPTRTDVIWTLAGNTLTSFRLVDDSTNLNLDLEEGGSLTLPVSVGALARIRFAADGLSAYIVDPNASNDVIQITLPNTSDASVLSFNGATIRVSGNSVLGLAPGDIALSSETVNGVTVPTAYVAARNTLLVKQFNVADSGTSGLTGGTSYYDNFNAYDLTQTTAITVSASNLLHVATRAGDLDTLDLSQGIVFVDSVLTPGLGTITSAVESGNTLFVASQYGNEIARFAIDPTTGIPTFQSTANNPTSLDSPAAFSLTDGGLYVVSSGDQSLTFVPMTGSSFDTPYPSLIQGDTFTRPLETLSAAAVSPDGNWLYAVSADEDEVVAYNRTTGSSSGFIDGFNGTLDLAGASTIAVDPTGTFIAVGSPVENAITLFQQTGSGLQFLQAFTGSHVSGVNALAFGPDGSLYATTASGQLTRFSVAANGTLTPLGSQAVASPSGLATDAAGVSVLSATAGTVTIFDAALSGVLQTLTGLGSVSAIASNATHLYAVNQSGTLFAFARSGFGGTLAPTQTILDNSGGVTGMLGGSGIAISADGQFVFVSGKTDNAIAVFGVSPTDGQLAFLQKITNGRGGVSGLNSPAGLFAVNGQLIAASAIGTGVAPGGFAVLDISTAIVPVPLDLSTSFTGIESLAVDTLDGDDTVMVTAAPAVPTTIDTGAGDDDVNVLATGTSLSVNLGAGDDRIDVDAADANATLGIIAGPGQDVVNIQGLGTGTAATVDVSGDTGTGDLVLIDGDGLAAGSTVQVTGDVHSTGTDDVLAYAAASPTITPSGASSGTITEPGQGVVTFTGLNVPGVNGQVFLHTPPRPVIETPPVISEGQGVTLTAVDEANIATTTFAWDLNGDGDFSDATGSTITLTWAQLQALGIDDNGSYRIAVRATNTGDPISEFAGGEYYISADAAATLVVLNTPPNVAVNGAGSVDLGATYTVTFSATGDPGNDRVSQWQINWGDGTIENYGSEAMTASHVYTTVGDYTVSASATDEDGTYTATQPVQVSPGVASISLSGPYSVIEGQSVTLTATAQGTPTQYLWDIDGNGTEFTTTVPTLTLTWAQLNALGASGDSVFNDLTVTADYVVAGNTFAGTSAPATLSVIDVAPSGVVTANVPSIPEGSAAGSLTVSLADISDLSSIDAAGGFQVRYDFNDDGTFDTGYLDPSIPVAVPADLFAASGLLTIRAELSDASGSRDLFATVAVTDVLPTLTLMSSATTLNEGDTLNLTTAANGPAAGTISSWIVNWGDGTADTGTGNPSSFAHAFDNPGDYTVTVTATGPGGDVASTLAIQVNAVAPVVMLSSPNASVAEGSLDSPFVLDLAVTHPTPETVAGMTIDWGDGTTQEIVGSPASVSHVYDRAGNYSVQVTSITNGEGTFANPSNALNVSVADVPPTSNDTSLSIPATGLIGTPVNLAAEAFTTEDGNDPLTFTWTITQPDGSTITLGGPGTKIVPNAITGPGITMDYASQVQFTPTMSGSYSVSLAITNSEGDLMTLSGAVAVANPVPVPVTVTIPATGTEGQPVNLAASFSDAEPLTYTWTVTNTTTGAVTTLTGPSVSFTPQSGVYAVLLHVSDTDGNTVQASGTLTVAAVPPQITVGSLNVPDTANEGDTDSFSVEAANADGTTDGLTFTWQVQGPSGAAVILNGQTVSFTYPDNGTYTVSVTVTSADGQSSTESQTVSVANLPPVIDSVSVPTVGIEGQTITFTATAHDPAGTADPLAFVWTVTQPDGTTAIVHGPNASFTPPVSGSYTVSLNVNDGDGGTTESQTNSIAVADADPTAGAIQIANGPFHEGDTVDLSIAASDVPTETLTYTWTVTAPDGTVTTLNGPAVSFVALEDGSDSISLAISDGVGGSTSRTATVPVANLDPVLDSFTVPASGFVNTAVPLAATATDFETLQYTWTIQRPDVSNFMVAGANAQFVPATPGAYMVTLTVTDGKGGSATATQTVSVAASGFTIGDFNVPISGTEGAPVTLSADASNSQGLSLAFNWVVNGPNGVQFRLTGSSVSFTPPSGGNYAVTLSVTNGVQTNTQSAAVDVANASPVISQFVVPGQIKFGGTVNLSAAATDPGNEVLTYSWVITRPDGSTENLAGPTPSFTADALGLFGVALTVQDTAGGSTTVRKLTAVFTSTITAHAVGNTVQVYGSDGTLEYTLTPFPGFTGTLNVATGDVNGDGAEDIVIAAGPGGGPRVRVYDGTTGLPLAGPLGDFFAFEPSFRGGVEIAIADVTGDGLPDLVVAAGHGGGPRITVYSGATGAVERSFFAFDPSFRGGVTLATGDINGDGIGDLIVAAGPGGGPQVKVFDGRDNSVLLSFFAFDPSLRGGVSIAVADVTGDGKADIIAGDGPGSAPNVKVFDGTGAVEESFAAFEPNFLGGVSVATGDANGDGIADIVVAAGPGGGPHIEVFNGPTHAPLLSFFAFDPNLRTGVLASIGDVNADGTADIIADLPGEAQPKVFEAMDGIQETGLFAKP